MKTSKLEWRVVLPTDNKIFYNIFDSYRFMSGLKDLKARVRKDSRIDIESEVIYLLKYCFWSKAEYEIIVSGLFRKEQHKIDAWRQIEANFLQFYAYLMEHWGEVPALSYKQQERIRKEMVGKNDKDRESTE